MLLHPCKVVWWGYRGVTGLIEVTVVPFRLVLRFDMQL